MKHRQILFEWGAAALITALAAILRLYTLGNSSVWWDEGYSMWYARMPAARLIEQIVGTESHPPFYHFTLKAWLIFAGQEEMAIRLLSVLAGVLTVAVVYRIGRTVQSVPAGLVASLLVAVAPLWVDWAQQTRMYALACLFAALAVWGAIQLWGGRRTLFWGTVLVLAEAAGMLTLYLFAGIAILLNLGCMYWLIVSRERKKVIGTWILTQVIAALICLPWYLYMRARTPLRPSDLAVDVWSTVRLYLNVSLLGVAENLDRHTGLLVVAVVILIGAGAASFWQAKGSRRALWLMLVSGVVLAPLFVVATFLLPQPRAFNSVAPSDRYFILLSLPVYVLLGSGLSAALSRWRWVAAISLIVLVGASGFNLATNYYPSRSLRDDYVSLASTLKALRQPGDVVVLNGNQDWPIFGYHYPLDYVSMPYQNITTRQARDFFTSILAESDGIWVVQTQYGVQFDPSNVVGQFLDKRAVATRQYRFPEAQLWFYAFSPERAAPEVMDRAVGLPPDVIPLNQPITDQAQLTGYSVIDSDYPAGERLSVNIAWQAQASGDWPVAIKLIAPDGRELTSADVLLHSSGAGSYWQPVELFVPPDALSGRAGIIMVAGPNYIHVGSVGIRTRAAGGGSRQAVSLPEGAVPLSVHFGPGITAAGAMVPDQRVWSPGDSIPLTIFWRSDAVVSESYKVFVHMYAASDDPKSPANVWGQDDQEPQEGASPTTSWQPGDVIQDDYIILIAENTPAGQYRLHIGVYLPLDFVRLIATDENGAEIGDSVRIADIEIGP